MSFFSTLKEAYDWTAGASKASSRRSPQQGPTPLLDLIAKTIDDLKSEGFLIQKDGASWRRLGWTISHPKWCPDAVVYLNWYAKSNFNYNENEEKAEWAQVWTRWLTSKGIPKLGKRTKFDSLETFDRDLRNIIKDFEVFQQNTQDIKR